MFATLLGALPRPSFGPDAAPEAVLDTCLALQAEHGLEPVADGGWPISEDVVESWRATTERAGRLVKAVIVGPWTSGRAVEDVRADVLALGDAGCPWIEVHEPALVTLASEERAGFADAHRRLTADLGWASTCRWRSLAATPMQQGSTRPSPAPTPASRST
jgi:hypothetical protein